MKKKMLFTGSAAGAGDATVVASGRSCKRPLSLAAKDGVVYVHRNTIVDT